MMSTNYYSIQIGHLEQMIRIKAVDPGHARKRIRRAEAIIAAAEAKKPISK